MRVLIILFLSVYFEMCALVLGQKSFPPYEFKLSNNSNEFKGYFRAPKVKTTYIDIIKDDRRDIEKCVCNPETPEFRYRKKNDRLCTIEYNHAYIKKEVTEKYAIQCEVYTRSQNVTVHIQLEAVGIITNRSILLSTIDGVKFNNTTINITASEGEKTGIHLFANAVSKITNIECEGKTRNGYVYGNRTGLNVYIYQEREAEVSTIFSKSTKGKIECQVHTTLPALRRFTVLIFVTVLERPLQKQLTLTKGDKNTNIPCRSNSLVQADIQFCTFVLIKKDNSHETKPGEINKSLCSITVGDFEEFRDVNKIKCNITVLGVKEVPVVYTIVMNTKFPVVEVAIGAGVVGGVVLIGVATYFIFKFKIKKPSGLLKNVDEVIPKPENARYVTQTSLQQGPPRAKQNDDVIIPAVIVAPLPGRKKKRKDKIKAPQPKPTFEVEEGEYEEIGLLPLKQGPPPAQPPEINMASLPRTLPTQQRSKSPKKIQSHTLEHKKPRPRLPSKPRADTMQGNMSRAPAKNNNQIQKPINLKRQPPVMEKPKEIIPKEKPIEKVHIPKNFLGELNEKLAKTPNVTGFTPITVRPTNLQGNEDEATYESVDFSNDHTDSREMMKHLIEDRRPPQPFPKPKKTSKDKLIEKAKNRKTSTREHESQPVLLGKSVLPKPVTPRTQVLAERPVLRPTVPAKSVYSGKPTEESPKEKVKGNWKPSVEKKGPTVSTKPLAFETNQTSNKSPLPKSQVDNVSRYSSESVSSDEETNFQQNQQTRKLPMPPPEGDSESLTSYESVQSDQEPESASIHRKNKSDKTYDELSSGEEWSDFDDIKVEPATYKSNPNPAHKASSNVNMPYEHNQPDSRGDVGTNLAQSDTNSVKRGVNSAPSGASSIPDGLKSVKSGSKAKVGGQQAGPGKGLKNKPLPPLPQNNYDIYENVKEIRPTIHYKGAKY